MTPRVPTLAFPELPRLDRALQRLIRQIPAGRSTTFGLLAGALGSRQAAIWVSRMIREWAGDDETLTQRVTSKSAADPGTLFADFRGEQPLKPLEDWLRTAAGFVNELPLRGTPRWIAGVDVAYPTADRAVAAAVLVDARRGEVIHELRIESPVSFPYLSGFLTFRELPAMRAAIGALSEASRVPEVVMVDGQGRLHPHRGGVATGFAAVSGLPTIGVAKSLLCGRVQPSSPVAGCAGIIVRDELLGWALRCRPDAKPVYVSVGGWLSLDEARDIARSQLGATRLPLPTHRADVLSKANHAAAANAGTRQSRSKRGSAESDHDRSAARKGSPPRYCSGD